MLYRWIFLFLLFAPGTGPLYSATLDHANGTVRVEVRGTGPEAQETVLVKVGDVWKPALSVASSALRIKTASGMKTCVLAQVSPIEHGLLLNRRL
jgi:hypothetical protein